MTTQAEDWRRDMRCVLNSLGECLANCPEACVCKQMPKVVFEDYMRTFGEKVDAAKEG